MRILLIEWDCSGYLKVHCLNSAMQSARATCWTGLDWTDWARLARLSHDSLVHVYRVYREERVYTWLWSN